MASSARSGSRWGNFLQQAVAGVESRLDTILADGEEVNKGAEHGRGTTPTSREASAAGLSLAGGTTSISDGMRIVTAGPIAQSAKQISPVPQVSKLDEPTDARSTQPDALENSVSSTSELPLLEHKASDAVALPGDGDDASFGSDQMETKVAKVATSASNSDLPVDTADVKLLEAQADHRTTIESETTIAELDQYVDRVEALRAKLAFVTEELHAKSLKQAKDVPVGTVDEKLALKDQKIAALVAEGERLSANEMKQLTMIRKLRSRCSEVSKRSDDMAVSLKTSEAKETTLAGKVRALESSQRQAQTQASELLTLRRQCLELKSEAEAKEQRVESLRKALDEARSQARDEEIESLQRQLQEQTASRLQLQDELAHVRATGVQREQGLEQQIEDIREQAAGDKRRAEMGDLSLRGELQVMESRLEMFRAQAENSKSEGQELSQTKMLRQIETLQNTYALASENWNGIETSLLARIDRLEQERNGSHDREADLRRKQREHAIAQRQIEQALEASQKQIQEVEDASDLQQRQKSELASELERTKQDLDFCRSEIGSLREMNGQQAAVLKQLREDHAKVRTPDRSPAPGAQSSFISSINRSSPGLGLGLSQDLPMGGGRPTSRRISTQVSNTHFASALTDSLASIQPSARSSTPGTPSIPLAVSDDFCERAPSAFTPEKSLNDLVSSTRTAAGPSVQLVERLSAAVRRLESEKSSMRDEMDRLLAQRDSQREEIVQAMREAEDRQAEGQKLATTEAELRETRHKLATTLEMLGEKSEVVEELRADIADMKDIYRATLDKTVK